MTLYRLPNNKLARSISGRAITIARRAVTTPPPPPAVVAPTVTGLALANAGTNSLTLSWTETGDPATVRVVTYRLHGSSSFLPLPGGTFGSTGGTITGLPTGPLAYDVQVLVTNAAGGTPVTLSNVSTVAAEIAADWDIVTPYSQVALGWKNANTQTLVGPFVTTNHRAQRGDVPPGYHLGLFKADGTAITTQQDSEAPPHRDGSFYSGTISAILPDSMTPTGTTGDTKSYFVKAVAGAPNRTPKFTLAAWSAANDLRLVIRTNLANLADDTSNFEFRANDAVTGGLYEGSSSGSDYPLTSIRVDRSGPVAMGWRLCGYARQKSSGAWHRQLKGEIYVTAVSLTDMLIDSQFKLPTAVATGSVFNVLQTVGAADNASLAPVVGIVELWNGSTLLHTWGGPGDYRRTTFAANAINLATNILSFPTTGAGRARNAVGYVFESTGTLPTGILPHKPYYPMPQYNKEQTYLVGRRAFFQYQGAPTVWTPGVAVLKYGTYNAFCVGARPAGSPFTYQVYAPVTAGTTGTTPPSGTADLITDGSVMWTPLNVKFVDQGTGTLSAWPVIHVAPACGTAFVDDQTADPVWTGAGPAPNVEVVKDLTYLIRYARALPPYDLTLTPLYPDMFPFDGVSACEPSVPAQIDDFGDNPGTPLIGYINFSSANALLQQDQVLVQRWNRAEALRWIDHWTFTDDPRSLQPVVGLNGPNNVAGQYAGLGPSMGDFAFSSPYTGTAVGKFTGIGQGVNLSYYNAKYSRYADPSHLPAMWIIPYEKTARAIFLDHGLSLANSTHLCAADTQGVRPKVISGRKYCATWMLYNQERGSGWATRHIGCVDDVLPAAHPMRAYWTDVISDGLDFTQATIELIRTTAPAIYARGGLIPTGGGYAVQHWFVSLQLLGWSQEARKGRRDGWRFCVEYLNKFWLRFLDEDQGGNSGLITWNNQQASNNFMVNSNILPGDVISFVPFDVNNSTGLPPVLNYTVPTGATPASVATGIVAQLNATPEYVAYGMVGVADEGNEWFRIRLPQSLFKGPKYTHYNSNTRPNVGAGAVSFVTVTAGGSGYTTAPVVAIVGAGLGATAVATVAGGVVTGVKVTANGSGYKDGTAGSTTCTFTGGGGTGATGHVSLGGKITVRSGLDNLVAFARPTVGGGIRAEFADWATLMEYNLGPNWPQTDTTHLVDGGTTPAFTGPVGIYPWDGVNYGVICLDTLATQSEAGITNSHKVYLRALARLANTGGGPTFSGFIGNSASLGITNKNCTFNNFAIRSFEQQALSVQH